MYTNKKKNDYEMFLKKFLKISPPYYSLSRTLIERKYPVDPTLADELPVEKYERRKEGETSVCVWGKSEHGAIGIYLQKRRKMKNRLDGRFTKFNRPLRLTFAEKHKVIDVAAGYGFSLFVVHNNYEGDRLFGTGINTDSQIGVHEPRRDAPLGMILSPVPINLPKIKKKLQIKNISAGRAHTAVVTSDGSVLTLGNNAYGQCGRPVIENEKYSGNKIVHRIPNCDGELAQTVVCGMDHTLILTEAGHVFSCGWGADGQTGLGHYQSCSQITRVTGDISNEKIVKISSRGDSVLCVNDKGDVFGWGNSEYSQLFEEGDPRPQCHTPTVLKKCRGFGKIIDIATSGTHCLMLNEEGDVFSWGYGVLGQGPVVQQSWVPRLIPSILFGRNEFRPDSKVVSVVTGIAFSAAITNYGDLYTWGRNDSSCLGLGDDKDQFFPFRVNLGQKAVKAALGVDHVVCLTKN